MILPNNKTAIVYWKNSQASIEISKVVSLETFIVYVIGHAYIKETVLAHLVSGQ